ncbi:8776_t:CDS:2 [Cetraspora pellucida]|uniref:8776_t:CDS:1 n=1 Tax=Cetraspora pellucida TaxID=1433469 RepID=A0ACA9K103_9GLOM|nr:8776_t:CDS:2 [Cetraspora pellucida]
MFVQLFSQELSNFELSQPTFSSRFNQDRQIIQVNNTLGNIDINSKEFINVINTTNNQDNLIIPSAEFVRDVPLDQYQLNLFRFRHRKIRKDSIIGVN